MMPLCSGSESKNSGASPVVASRPDGVLGPDDASWAGALEDAGESDAGEPGQSVSPPGEGSGRRRGEGGSGWGPVQRPTEQNKDLVCYVCSQLFSLSGVRDVSGVKQQINKSYFVLNISKYSVFF